MLQYFDFHQEQELSVAIPRLISIHPQIKFLILHYQTADLQPENSNLSTALLLKLTSFFHDFH